MKKTGTLILLLSTLWLAACGPHMREGIQQDSQALAERMQTFAIGLDEP
ncbi:MAG: hypothetical protein H6865_06275 [Rhodospirillales bacterium]|nr:hypothetical protein [Alphaproteobacteria bacterium]MCB9987227.1 hypothetical protein [Rhodospirillales bacterium]USO07912.1 MAG: hypothetical protein H6866_01425 [Rhodospirillales bacterium]